MKISLLCQHFYVNNKLQPKPTFIDIIALFFFLNYREQFANEDKKSHKKWTKCEMLIVVSPDSGHNFYLH